MPMSSQAARAKRVAQLSNRPARKPDFDQGYFRLPTAAVWQGAPAPGATNRPRRLVRWAVRPHKTPLGLCLAVEACPDGGFRVCIERAGVRTWRDWKEVEGFAGVGQWVRRCF